ncbi:hypothetical protein JW851_01390 [Candidatus Woesearchaeota archaeon]|nr:hypothetical protein [Candidatus Woesearchaeota archaeon]
MEYTKKLALVKQIAKQLGINLKDVKLAIASDSEEAVAQSKNGDITATVLPAGHIIINGHNKPEIFIEIVDYKKDNVPAGAEYKITTNVLNNSDFRIDGDVPYFYSGSQGFMLDKISKKISKKKVTKSVKSHYKHAAGIFEGTTNRNINSRLQRNFDIEKEEDYRPCNRNTTWDLSVAARKAYNSSAVVDSIPTIAILLDERYLGERKIPVSKFAFVEIDTREGIKKLTEFYMTNLHKIPEESKIRIFTGHETVEEIESKMIKHLFHPISTNMFKSGLESQEKPRSQKLPHPSRLVSSGGIIFFENERETYI